MEEPNNNFPQSPKNNNFENPEPLIPQGNIPENPPQSENLNLPMEFNYYPMPNRKDSMSRRGLDETDFPKRKFKQLSTKRDFSLNNYSLDIEGAAPRSNSIFTNKIDYTLKSQDIEKATPKKMIPEKTNKPNYNLNNRDIEGTLPRGHHCFTTSRHCDPLNPVYPLPSAGVKFPPEVPKFLRNTLDIRDIPGATAKENKINYCETDHNYMDVYRRNRDDDILLDHKKLYKGNKNKLYNSLDFRDVYKIPPFSNRHTNPLEPKYRYDYKMTEINNGKNKADSLVYGEIDGNRPVVFSKYNNVRYGKGMKTNDIEGAQPNTTSSYSKFQNKHKHPLKYSAEDIVGAHHDTLLKSIITKRNTNPLDPKYQFLGDKGKDFDEDSRKFRAKFDYSSLYDFYYNNSKIAIKQREDEMKKDNIEKNKNNISPDEKKLNNKNENMNKKIFFNFGEDKKVYQVEKVDTTESEKKKLVGENYLKMLQDRENNNNSPKHFRAHSAEKENEKMIEDTIKKDFPDPKDIPEFNEYNKFNDKNYSKPEIYYGFQHEQYIISSNPNNKSGKDVSIKVLQDLQNNFENARDFKKSKNNNNNNSNTYASQLDRFISKFPGIK